MMGSSIITAAYENSTDIGPRAGTGKTTFPIFYGVSPSI